MCPKHLNLNGCLCTLQSSSCLDEGFLSRTEQLLEGPLGKTGCGVLVETEYLSWVSH